MDQFTAQLQHVWNHLTDRAPEFLITLAVGLVVVEILIFLLSSVLRLARIPAGLKHLLFSLARMFLWVVLFLVVIQTLGLNNVLVAITGSSVIVALFLSTGVAPLITDLLSGLTLAGDRSFQPGSRVIAGGNKTEGIIESLDIRKTRIRDRQGKLHVLPNTDIDNHEWVVLSHAPKAIRRTKRRRHTV